MPNKEININMLSKYNIEDLIPILDLMENTTEIDVPLKVEHGFGANWREAH